MTGGQLDRDPGGNRRPLTGLEGRVVQRAEVIAGVVVVRASRQPRARVQPLDAKLADAHLG